MGSFTDYTIKKFNLQPESKPHSFTKYTMQLAEKQGVKIPQQQQPAPVDPTYYKDGYHDWLKTQSVADLYSRELVNQAIEKNNRGYQKQIQNSRDAAYTYNLTTVQNELQRLQQRQQKDDQQRQNRIQQMQLDYINQKQFEKVYFTQGSFP